MNQLDDIFSVIRVHSFKLYLPQEYSDTGTGQDVKVPGSCQGMVVYTGFDKASNPDATATVDMGHFEVPSSHIPLVKFCCDAKDQQYHYPSSNAERLFMAVLDPNYGHSITGNAAS